MTASEQLLAGLRSAPAYFSTIGPAVLALTGVGVLLVGARRTVAVATWVPVAGSAVLVLMGSVLHAPHWLHWAIPAAGVVLVVAVAKGLDRGRKSRDVGPSA